MMIFLCARAERAGRGAAGAARAAGSHHEEGDEEEGAGEVDEGGLAVDGLRGLQARWSAPREGKGQALDMSTGWCSH
jgi:hypothetical protein